MTRFTVQLRPLANEGTFAVGEESGTLYIRSEKGGWVVVIGRGYAAGREGMEVPFHDLDKHEILPAGTRVEIIT